MMKITGLSHLFKWENLHNWWLTKYFFAPLYVHMASSYSRLSEHDVESSCFQIVNLTAIRDVQPRYQETALVRFPLMEVSLSQVYSYLKLPP